MADPRLDRWKDLVLARSRAERQPLSAEVLEELASHLADVYDAERERGGAVADATASANAVLERASFEELAGTRRVAASTTLPDRARPGRSRLWLDAWFDVRYALRAMRRSASFSVAVIAVFAIGIGATTAAFTVVESVILRPLPYPDPSRLVVLKRVTPTEESGAFSPADWQDYVRAHGRMLTMAAYASWPMNLTGGGEPERLRSVIVSGRFFEVAGVAPLAGRVSTPQDDTPAAPAVVVLSDGFWRRRFGGDPRSIGSTISLNGRPAVVVGVMPPSFALPDPSTDLWMPMGLAPQVLADRSGGWLSLIGRLQPGAGVDAAQAALTATAARLARMFPRTNGASRVAVRPLLDEVVGRARRALWLGGLAALFVLLTGSANAANLLLARATRGRDEIAVRAALGAEPLRLARQLLAESAVFAAFGGALGLALSWAFLRAFERLGDGRVPRLDDLHLGAVSMLTATVASLVAAGAVGGAAAWWLLRSDGPAISRPGTGRVTRPVATEGVLLAAQVAFAMILVTGASLIIASYVETVRVDPGFDASDTTTMQMTLPRTGYPDDASQIRFAERALAAVTALPGVAAAGIVTDLPFVGNATHFPVAVEGNAADSSRMMTIRVADPGFFKTLRVPLAAGRYLGPDDRGHTPAVAVLNQSAARQLGARALGLRLAVSGEPPRIVVGIVGDIKHAGLHRDEGPVLYVPYAQKSFAFLNWMGLVVRTPGASLSARELKTAIASVDPNQPIEAVASMTDYLERETAPYRFSALVIGSLAGAALVLAVTGIYGLTSFVVLGRSRELAVRIALGATRRSIVLMVFGGVARILVLGGLAGLAGSLLTNRLLLATLSESGSAGSAGTAAFGCALIGVSAALATLGPALQAARVDPSEALRCE